MHEARAWRVRVQKGLGSCWEVDRRSKGTEQCQQGVGSYEKKGKRYRKHARKEWKVKRCVQTNGGKKGSLESSKSRESSREKEERGGRNGTLKDWKWEVWSHAEEEWKVKRGKIKRYR